jgi:hypothetical protein
VPAGPFAPEASDRFEFSCMRRGQLRVKGGGSRRVSSEIRFNRLKSL